MPRKSPEEELASFEASLPKFVRLYLQGNVDDWDEADTRAYFQSDSTRTTQLIKEYEQLLRRCPAKYREYREKRLRSHGLPPLPRGRPRKDAEAAEASALKASGKSWQSVGNAQGKTRDAARKLAALRRKPQGK